MDISLWLRNMAVLTGYSQNSVYMAGCLDHTCQGSRLSASTLYGLQTYWTNINQHPILKLAALGQSDAPSYNSAACPYATCYVTDLWRQEWDWREQRCIEIQILSSNILIYEHKNIDYKDFLLTLLYMFPLFPKCVLTF